MFPWGPLGRRDPGHLPQFSQRLLVSQEFWPKSRAPGSPPFLFRDLPSGLGRGAVFPPSAPKALVRWGCSWGLKAVRATF